MKGINYNKLKRFDIGTRPTNPGYQTNTSVVDTSSFASNSGYDMSGDVQALQNKWMPTVLSGVLNLGNVAMNVAKNYTTESAAAAAGTKAGMNAVGKAASIVGSIYGTGSMIKDFVDFSDRLKGTDMQNMSAESIQSKNGISYKTYDGFNQKQVDDYTDAQNKAGVWSSTLNGLSAGASFGSMFSYLGTAIGGIAGGLTGLVGGLIGGGRRKRKIEESKNNVLGTQSGYNAQAESEAGSQGLRNSFYEGRADKGKAPGLTLGGNQYGMIQTPSGPTYGKIEGLASPDEGMIDMATGETKYLGSKNMNVKDIRKDIVPVGIRGAFDAGSSPAFTERIGIPGHGVKDEFGLTPADYARPLFKRNDQLTDNMAFIDAKIEENNNHKTRDKATSKYIANKLGKMKDLMQQERLLISQLIANIVDSQTQALNGNMFNCGKTPRYWDGKNWFSEYMKPITLNKPTSWRSATKYPSLSNDMTFNVPTVDDMRKEIFKGLRSVPKYNLDFVKDAKPIKLGDVPEPEDVEFEFEKSKTDTNTTGPGDIFNSVFGVTDAGVGPGWGLLQSLPYAIGETIAANADSPYAQNSFVPNHTAATALNIMRGLRYDPTNQLNLLRSANRQSLYNINNAASLSAGQRAALASANNIATAQAANSIHDKSQDINNAYRAQYANSLMSYGQDTANRLQQANAYQQEAYRQAVGAQQKLKALARKNWYTLSRQALQDYGTMLNTKGMMDLWNKKLDNDKAAVNNTANAKPTSTSNSKSIVKPTIKSDAPKKSDMTAKPGETVADTIRKSNPMSYALVAAIAAKKNKSANAAWRHYMKYGNLNNL